MKVNLEIDVGQKTFSNGLLPELIPPRSGAAGRRSFRSRDHPVNMNADFEAWWDLGQARTALACQTIDHL